MPLIENNKFKPPYYLRNGHLETIYSNSFRKVPQVNYTRERIDTSDGDFLDLDWLRSDNPQLVILSHGLEGNSRRVYIQGMVKAFADQGWDALAWNCRSCSGEMNKLPRFYHHGEIGDLGQVIEHVITNFPYKRLVLIGFSMGGSMILKYLGKNGKQVDSRIDRAIVFSVPCDLRTSELTLERGINLIYKRRFLRRLKRKIQNKSLALAGRLNIEDLPKVKTFSDFDTYFTVPLHGFKDPQDFYHQASAKNFLEGISIPTLLVNAANDPMLEGDCYPTEKASHHTYLYLEIPKYGGHVGFCQPPQTLSWAEKRAL